MWKATGTWPAVRDLKNCTLSLSGAPWPLKTSPCMSGPFYSLFQQKVTSSVYQSEHGLPRVILTLTPYHFEPKHSAWLERREENKQGGKQSRKNERDRAF